MQQHCFKPALLAKARCYRLEPSALVCATPEGAEHWRLPWADVQRAVFVDHRIKGMRLRRLDLIPNDGTSKQSVSCTGAGGDPRNDPEASAHLELVATILDRLAGRDGGFEVGVGEYGRYRLAIFVTGVLSVAGAVGIGGLALASGVSGDRLAGAAVPLLVLLAFGGLLVMQQAPWRPVPRIDAAVFAEALRNMLRPDD